MPYKRFVLTFLICLITIAALLEACGTFQIGIERTPVPDISVSATIDALIAVNDQLATLVALPTSTLTPTSTVIPGDSPPTRPSSPTPTPTQPPPSFSGLHFAPAPREDLSQKVFVAGTPRIYAIWRYTDMTNDSLVQRVWTRNGGEWIVREELWDFEQYGANGINLNTVVYESEFGLQPGEYRLSLSIDGMEQDMTSSKSGLLNNSADPSVFWIVESDIRYPVPSPDKSYTAIVRYGGRLTIEDPDGEMRDLVEVAEISSLVWFPDGRHLLFVERDRTAQANPEDTSQLIHKLWVLDVRNGSRHLLSTSGENFHTPQISPDGSYVAVFAGNSDQIGCQVSPLFAIIDLDEEYHRQAVIMVESFSGLPYSTGEYGIYPNTSRIPGRWQSSSQIQVDLAWSCLSSGATRPNGAYILDMEKMRAERVTEP